MSRPAVLADGVKSMIVRRGVTGGVAKRFIAGEHLHEALQYVKSLKEQNITASLNYLGENFTSAEDTDASVAAYVEAIKAVSAFYPDAVVSVKLTAIGLTSDPALARKNLHRLLEEAAGRGNVFLRIDMEDSRYTAEILKIVWETYKTHSNIGAVVQSYLRRTDRDIEVLLDLGIPVRLVRGSYDESSSVAYKREDEIDAAYRRQMFRLLDSDKYHTISTHDTAMLDAAKLYIRKKSIPKYRFEFESQMGMNPDGQKKLLAEGYRVRVDVPYGEAWLGYLLRCLGDKSVGTGFVLANLLR